MLWSRENFGKETFWLLILKNLKKLDASEIYPRRLNAKEVLTTHKDGEFVFPVADGSATVSGRDYEFQEPTPRRESTVKRERISAENLKAIGKSVNLKKQKMTRKLKKTSGLFKETSFTVTIRTESQTLLTKRRVIPFSTEIYRYHQVSSHRSGCDARKTNWWLLECRRR